MSDSITFNVPKGFEIDRENSTSRCVKIKLKDPLTLSEIIESQKDKLHRAACNFLVKDKNQKAKLIAFNDLMNIAEYYNEGWIPDWDDKKEKKYGFVRCGKKWQVDCLLETGFSLGVYFKRVEDAQAVLLNPNFKYIFKSLF